MAGGQELRRIGDFEALCRYLEDGLGWPLGEHDFDSLTFQYEPDELGLQGEYADAIESIHQMRPAVDGQPWGIFFVRFKKKQLPIGVLRRILSQLALKKRAAANRADRNAWDIDDLLFVSAFGEGSGSNQEIAFAHFHQHQNDLPTLRVLGWDGQDTPLKLEYLQGVLREKLHWPADTGDVEAWRKLWHSPFRHRPGHVIRKSDELAKELARLAKSIRDKASDVMKAESAKGAITKLYGAFKKSLIHDLTPEGFADTYAQTITYGLLTAAISRTDMEEGRHGTALVASNLADMVPVTNPFLKEMLQTFLAAGGRKSGIDFDELGIQDVVELLRGEDTDLPAILRDFGNKTKGEDPVIHFYEHFLTAYNKQLKIQRGVFYTPQPVVSYIVRSVHELLQTEFGLVDGLADTTTWGEMLAKHPEMKLPLLTDEPGDKRTISPDEPFVQILDPATGTATFLVEVIDVIHRTLVTKWKQERLTEAEQRVAWNDYVPRHLLPRLHAFELMMAPYAIAHMKIGLKLAETGYRFGTEERARIYLTNALEPWVKQLPLIGFEALAHEAAAVNDIKRNKRFTVVVGNPPYSNFGQLNKIPFVLGLLDDYKRGLNERKLNLDDDFIKFIRLGQWFLDNSGVGVLGFITSNTFIDGITHRRMRESLSDAFRKICIMDLHGNSVKQEKVPDGSKDENVFDIKQGVSIGLFVKKLWSDKKLEILHSELWGSRKSKYDQLNKNTWLSVSAGNVITSLPYLFFVPKNMSQRSEYENFTSVHDAMPVGTSAIQTKRDALFVDFSKDSLANRMREVISNGATPEMKAKYPLEASAGWAPDCLIGAEYSEDRVKRYLYRPFDMRSIYYDDSLLGRSRIKVFKHLLRPNLALSTLRQTVDDSFRHIFCSSTICDINLTIGHHVSDQVFPLYIYPEEGSLGLGDRVPNFSPDFIRSVEAVTGLKFGHGDRGNLISTVGPEDLFAFIYSIFHSPGYRTRYAEFLKIEFPRVPLTAKLELFRTLVTIGAELISVHLLESPKLDKPIIKIVGDRDPVVESISWLNGSVWLDKELAAGFQGVNKGVWEFHVGGYQVCHKWLKDRKGRKLSNEDIAHYQKIVVAISETIRMMAEIDAAIDQHGGWPGAFATTGSPVSNDDSIPTELPPVAKRRPAEEEVKRPSEGLFPITQDQSPPEVSHKERPTRGVQEEPDRDELCAEIRQLFSGSQTYERDAAIKSLATALGHQRVGTNIREELDNALRTAVRRGILTNESGELQLHYRTMEQYEAVDRNGLKDQFVASIGRAWIEREEAAIAFARWLGFRRTGPKIEEIAASLINGLIREGRLEKNQNQIRRAG